ncbi:MAG: GGDEF domain-containing protein [Gemmatimonadales bacterium]
MSPPTARDSRAVRLWRWLIAAPDEALADASRDGELVVARVRTWLTLLITLSPLISLILEPSQTQNYIGLAVALTAVLMAILLERALQTGGYKSEISFLSAVIDVSLVSFGLFAFWFIGMPLVTTNSRVVFEVYFIAIGASALRYDTRVTVVAGVAAVLEYGLLSELTWYLHTPEEMRRGIEEYGTFSASTQVSRLIMLVAMTAVALSIVGRSQRLRRQSTSDRLTGLFNRPYAEDFLENEVLQTARTKTSMVVGMLDVDHFKNFNDTFGHAAGDMALKELARVLKAALRRTDVVARYGGEEILLVMPGTDITRAMEKLDEVRVQIGLTDIVLPRGGTSRITVSIGVAGFGVDGTDVDALLDIADRRLYQAKDAGRNRIVGPEALPQQA